MFVFIADMTNYRMDLYCSYLNTLSNKPTTQQISREI